MEISTESVAIIPARGGSKGIPRKNLALLGGVPLVAWAIRCALAASSITRVVVSTDSPEIAECARFYGAETPFLRPGEISGARSTIGEVAHHALNYLDKEGYHPQVTCILLPTHPFRKPYYIDQCVKQVFNGYHNVYFCKKVSCIDGTFFRLKDDDSVTQMKKYPFGIFKSASYSGWYRRYGTAAAHAYHITSKYSQFFFEIRNPIECIDIDTYEDLEVAEEVIQNNLYDFGL